MPISLIIAAPGFELQQAVWLNFQGAAIPTHIKQRAYFIDRNGWYYRASLSGHWHQETEFSPRPASEESEALIS